MPDNQISLGDVKQENIQAPLNLSIDQQIKASDDLPNKQPKMIHMAQPGIKPKVDINSLRNNRGAVNTNNRVSANLNNLPVRDEVPEGLNLKVKDSLEAEIFEKGGMFDQYLADKKNEYAEWAADRQQKAEEQKLEEEAAKEDADIDNEESDTQSVKTENTEEDKVTNIPEARQLKMVDIRKPPKKDEDHKMENIVNGNVQEFANGSVDEEEYIISKPTPEDEYDPEEEEEVDEEEYDIPEDVTERNSTDVVEDVEDDPIDYETTSDIEEDFLEEGEEIEEEYQETENLNVSNQPITPKKKKTGINSKIDKITRSYMAIPSEEDEDEDVEVDIDDNDESINILKNMIAQKIKPVSLKTDITGFTIAKKGTMSNDILTMDHAAFAKWPLPATGITVSMREISGANLENLRGFLDRNIPDNRSALKIIYDHIVSPKPDSFEAWLKSIAYADFDNLFMLVYISAFADANFLPVDCTSETCGKPYLTDSLPIMEMVKFKNSETEQKFWDLYNEEPSNAKGLYTTEVMAISGDFAIGLKEPSLYSVLIEPQYFNSEFTEKHAQTIRYFPYIDSIYWIDAARKTLVPIKWKVYDNNIAKSVRSRVRRYDKIINLLSSDQHALILAYINAINDRIDWFNYRIPETTCPHCGQVVEANDNYTALNLVFLRNRLAVLATT